MPSLLPMICWRSDCCRDSLPTEYRCPTRSRSSVTTTLTLRPLPPCLCLRFGSLGTRWVFGLRNFFAEIEALENDAPHEHQHLVFAPDLVVRRSTMRPKKSARRSGGETIHKCGYEAPIGATA